MPERELKKYNVNNNIVYVTLTRALFTCQSIFIVKSSVSYYFWSHSADSVSVFTKYPHISLEYRVWFIFFQACFSGLFSFLEFRMSYFLPVISRSSTSIYKDCLKPKVHSFHELNKDCRNSQILDVIMDKWLGIHRNNEE